MLHRLCDGARAAWPDIVGGFQPVLRPDECRLYFLLPLQSIRLGLEPVRHCRGGLAALSHRPAPASPDTGTRGRPALDGPHGPESWFRSENLPRSSDHLVDAGHARHGRLAPMKRSEVLSRVLVVVGLLLVLAIPFAAQRMGAQGVIEMHGRMADSGSW